MKPLHVAFQGIVLSLIIMPTTIAQDSLQHAQPSKNFPQSCASGCLAQQSSESDNSASSEEEIEEELTVVGTRTPRRIDQTPASVTIIDNEEIEQNLVQTLRDLVRYEPNVSVRRNSRFGFQDFNIRGIEGNRNLIQVDGIRLPALFELGPFSLGRDYVELDTLKTVEILRGPGSTLYGSDALGGVVRFQTLEPKDLLDQVNRNWYVSVSPSLNSQDLGISTTATIAGRSKNFEALFSYTRRDFQEPFTNGDPTFRDEQDGESNSYLGKFVYRINPFNTLKLTAEALDRNVQTNIAIANLADETGVPPGIPPRTRSFFSNLDTNRERISLQYEFKKEDNPILQLARLQVYFQNATSAETTLEQRIASAPTLNLPTTPITLRRDGINRFTDQIWGADVQLESNFKTGTVNHRLTYGIDVSAQRNTRPRDKVQTNLVTGAQTTSVIPDNFPSKDFPDSETTRLGAYLQDEISFAKGKFTLIPGIRYDYYDLNTFPDEDYLRNGSPPPTNLTANSFSPKLGFVWSPTDELSVFGQYARGFRAPLYNEINSGFSNFSTFPPYSTIPNPDLKPETSDSFELGLRGTFPRGRFSVAGFYSSYNNFIQPLVQVSAPGVFPLVFQTQNVSQARIYGVEASAEYRFSQGDAGFSLFGSLAYTVGDDLTQDIPLNTIDPFKAVVGVRYKAPENKWGVGLYGTFVASPRTPITVQRPTPFVPDAYGTVDLIGYYNLSRTLSLNLGVYNLLDTRYYQYSDVRNFNADDPRVDRFAQPGINVGVGVTWRF
jgi:hemoglobin/transferrin/lactoferrin receptor protein